MRTMKNKPITIIVHKPSDEDAFKAAYSKAVSEVLYSLAKKSTK